MPMPVLLTQTGTGTSAVWIADWMQVPFNVGIQVIPGGVGCSVEYTLDPLDTATATATNWFPVSGLTAVSSSTTNSVSFPVRAFRINALTSSAGSVVSVSFVQATFPR